MSFSDSPEAVADELARRLESQPAVVATDRLSADVSLSGRETVEATVKSTDRGTLPNAVTRAVVQSSLGIAEVSPANAPEHKVVIIR
jgi:hypothetical protein